MIITKKQIQLAVIFFTLFIDMIGFGIIIPILPRYAEQFGATSFQIGLIVACYSLSQFVMLPVWGKMSDHVGRKPVLLLSVFGTAAGYLLMGFSHTVILLIIARIIDGGAGGNMGTAQAYVSDITAPEERSKVIGSLGAAYGLGFIIGPALGGIVASRYGVAAPMFLAGGFAILNFLMIVAFLPESLAKKKSPLPEASAEPLGFWKSVNKKIYIPVLFTLFFFITGFAIMTTVFALFVYHRYDLNEQQAGYIYAMIGCIAIVIEGLLFGALSKRFGDRCLARVGACCIALGLFLLPLSSHLAGVFIFCAMVAVGDSLITPALPSIVSRVVKRQWQGTALGFYQSVGSFGRFTGPLIGGYFLAFNLDGPIKDYARVAFFVASGLLAIAFFCSLKIPNPNISD